ncbi:hypothetical protein VTI28DRAFT_1218 [Corynascus sepedonium]
MTISLISSVSNDAYTVRRNPDDTTIRQPDDLDRQNPTCFPFQSTPSTYSANKCTLSQPRRRLLAIKNPQCLPR